MTATEAAALGFVCLAVAHSALGEKRFIPKVIDAWSDAEMSQQIFSRIMRSAWHATSLAWLCIALLLVEVSPALAVVVGAGLPGIFLLLWVPSHPAWALFLFVSLAVAFAQGLLVPSWLAMSVHVTTLVLLLLAGLHAYWVLGGRAGMLIAIPGQAGAGGPVFTPPRLVTAVVALALAGYAGLIEWLIVDSAPGFVYWLVLAGVVAMVGRGIGDGKYVGLFKTVRQTPFARLDTRYYTPLVFLLSFGSGASLLLASG